MKQLLIWLLCLGLVGCVTLPGGITERVSGFDKAKEIEMEPAWVGNSLKDSPIGLGLYKTSKMGEDEAMLIVSIKGAYNFAPGESLQFNIDGDIIKFASIDTTTNIELNEGVHNSVAYIPPSNSSSKRYEIKKDLIKRLIEGKEVWVKVELAREYFEAKFSISVPMCARNGFRKFYKKVWEEDIKVKK